MIFSAVEPIDQPAEKVSNRMTNPLLFPPKPERYEKLAYVRLVRFFKR